MLFKPQENLYFLRRHCPILDHSDYFVILRSIPCITCGAYSTFRPIRVPTHLTPRTHFTSGLSPSAHSPVVHPGGTSDDWEKGILTAIANAVCSCVPSEQGRAVYRFVAHPRIHHHMQLEPIGLRHRGLGA